MDPLVRPSNVRSFQRAVVPRYPHLSVEDSSIWTACLRVHRPKFERIEYDVCLGSCGQAVAEGELSYRRMWMKLRSKRLDVVGWIQGRVTIIELKPIAGFSALGQLLGYGHLWESERPGDPLDRLVCVCWSVDPDLKPVFDRHGIEVWTVPLPSSASRS